MNNKDANFLEREEKAKKKRLQAQTFLEESGCGPSQHQQRIAKVGLVAALSQRGKCKPSAGGDNTLSILKKRKLEQDGLNTKNSSDISIKNCPGNLPKEGGVAKTRVSADIPHPWEEISDHVSGKIYYWNKVTNVTTWEYPPATSCSKVQNIASLPSGWKEIIHPATKQKYYLHTRSGEKTWTYPTQENGEEKRA